MADVNAACDCTDASLRADYLRTLGVPLTRFAQGTLRDGEPRRIDWLSPLSVAELERLALLAFELARRAEKHDPVAEAFGADDIEIPEDEDMDAAAAVALFDAALAERREREQKWNDNRQANRRARRAKGVASGLRARDVN